MHLRMKWKLDLRAIDFSTFFLDSAVYEQRKECSLSSFISKDPWQFQAKDTRGAYECSNTRWDLDCAINCNGLGYLLHP
jgi:hypothetical protein